MTFSLDKAFYNVGDTAILIVNLSGTPGSYNAIVQLDNFVDSQPFELTNGNTVTLIFKVPVAFDQKLRIGIYEATGRALYYNAEYIYPATAGVQLSLSQQVYVPGDVASVTITSNVDGTLTLSAPGPWTNTTSDTLTLTLTANSNVTESFAVPDHVAGTYDVGYQFMPSASSQGAAVSGQVLFDVSGAQGMVQARSLDRSTYSPGQSPVLNLTLSVNKNLNAVVEIYLVNSNGTERLLRTQNVSLSQGTNKLSFTLGLPAYVPGTDYIAYKVMYVDPPIPNTGGDPQLQLLTGGVEAFDVPGLFLSGITPLLSSFSSCQDVNIDVDVSGTGNGTLTVLVDGNTFSTQSVSGSGFFTVPYDLGILTPGTHLIEAQLNGQSIGTQIYVNGIAYPLAPQGFGVQVSSNNATLTWQESQDLSIVSYKIYRAPLGSNSFVNIATVNAGTTSYVDANLAPGSYTWEITSVTSDGIESQTGSYVSADIGPPLIVNGVQNLTAEEGNTFSGIIAPFQDPTGPDTASDYSATVNWGDGTTSSGSISLSSNGVFVVSGSHVYAKNGTYGIQVQISDSDGSTGEVTEPISVSVAPIVVTVMTIQAVAGVPLNNVLVATFIDYGGKKPVSFYHAEINWGDGTTSAGVITDPPEPYKVYGSHTYTKSGTYTLGVIMGMNSGVTISGTSPSPIHVSAPTPTTSSLPVPSPIAVSKPPVPVVTPPPSISIPSAPKPVGPTPPTAKKPPLVIHRPKVYSMFNWQLMIVIIAAILALAGGLAWVFRRRYMFR